MSEQLSTPRESIAYSGKIGEVITTELGDGRVFERYRRPPGTRLVIVSPEGKILVTKEYRHETGDIDLRLPGGKVRDTREAYHELLASGQDMTEAASEAAAKEALEETGLIVHNPRLITIANAGATVEWDLYYFLIDEYDEHPDGQHLEHGENIEVTWATPEEIVTAVKAGNMQEMRSVGVLLGMVLSGLQR